MDSLLNSFQNCIVAKGSRMELIVSASSIPEASCATAYLGVASKIHTTPDVTRCRSALTKKMEATTEVVFDIDAEYDSLLKRRRKKTKLTQNFLDGDLTTRKNKLLYTDLDDGSIVCHTRRGELVILPAQIKITRLSDEIIKKVLEPASAAKISSNPFYESMYEECEIKSKRSAAMLAQESPAPGFYKTKMKTLPKSKASRSSADTNFKQKPNSKKNYSIQSDVRQPSKQAGMSKGTKLMEVNKCLKFAATNKIKPHSSGVKVNRKKKLRSEKGKAAKAEAPRIAGPSTKGSNVLDSNNVSLGVQETTMYGPLDEDSLLKLGKPTRQVAEVKHAIAQLLNPNHSPNYNGFPKKKSATAGEMTETLNSMGRQRARNYSSSSGSQSSTKKELAEILGSEESLKHDHTTTKTNNHTAALPSVPDLCGFAEPIASSSST